MTYMRWPFSKKHPQLNIPPQAQQRWGVAQGRYGDRLLVRFNETARELAGHPDLSIKLGFAMPFNRPNEGGLPDPEENVQLAAIEDLIVHRVLSGEVGLHALTLTNGVMKEFVFYIPPGRDIAGLHSALRAEVSTHDVQCLAIKDPDWNSFRDFIS